jgi:hypothetical protein
VKQERWIGVLAALVIALGVAAVAAPARVTLFLSEMEAYVGQRLEARVVADATGEEVLRVLTTAVPAGAFDLVLEPLETEAAYRVDLYVDVNGDGGYDRPPEDAAWRVDLGIVAGDASVPFSATAEMTDVDWPPASDGAIAPEEYRHVLVDQGTNIVLFWQNDASTLYVGLVGPGTGWVAVGFDAKNRMQGANILIGAVTAGTLTLEDQFGSGPFSHRGDRVSSLLQRGGSEVDGKTIIEFALPLAAGEADDVALSPGQTVTVLLSFHSTSDGLTTKHTGRSTVTITLDEEER